MKHREQLIGPDGELQTATDFLKLAEDFFDSHDDPEKQKIIQNFLTIYEEYEAAKLSVETQMVLVDIYRNIVIPTSLIIFYIYTAYPTQEGEYFPFRASLPILAFILDVIGLAEASVHAKNKFHAHLIDDEKAKEILLKYNAPLAMKTDLPNIEVIYRLEARQKKQLVLEAAKQLGLTHSENFSFKALVKEIKKYRKREEQKSQTVLMQKEKERDKKLQLTRENEARQRLGLDLIDENEDKQILEKPKSTLKEDN